MCFLWIVQCINLVDYYVPLFFLEATSVQPGDFCNKVNLCQTIADLSLQVQENSCEFCEDTVSALLAKIKDPDTEVRNFILMDVACFNYFYNFKLIVLGIYFKLDYLLCKKVYDLQPNENKFDNNWYNISKIIHNIIIGIKICNKWKRKRYVPSIPKYRTLWDFSVSLFIGHFFELSTISIISNYT